MAQINNVNSFQTLDRTNISKGLSLPSSQLSSIPTDVDNVFSLYPSATTPQWGAPFIIDVKDINMIVHNMALLFNISAISGTTGATNLRFNPAYFWINHIDLKISGKIIDTYYPGQQFLLQQILYDDEDRIYSNNGAGHYASLAQRTTLAASTSNYIVKLFTCFDQCNLPIVLQNQPIQLVVYMDQLTNVVINNGTGTPSCTINSCQLVVKNSKINSNVANQILATLPSAPKSIYHKLLYMAYPVQSGVSSFNCILNTMVGNIAMIFFTLRPTTGLTGDGQFTYSPVSTFHILDATNNSLCGGQPIPSAVALNYLNLYYFGSSYCIENATASIDNTGTVVNNNAYVYAYSFSNDTLGALLNGQLNSSKTFRGTEQLIINFNSALSGTYQIDVYCMAESVITADVNGYEGHLL